MAENISDNSGHRLRLRSRFLAGGISALAEYEIVELLLMFAIPRKDVKPVAKKLVQKYGGVKQILNSDPRELMQVGGLGESSACLVKLMRELIPLYHLQTLEAEPITLDSVDKLIEFFRARMEGLKNEVLEMACFDGELRLMQNGAIRLFEGSSNTAKADIRRIIEITIKLGATSIVLAHNHPNGSAEPSFDDIAFTRRLSLACKSINLNFIEHIIVAKSATFSFRRDGHFDSLYDTTVPDEDGGEGAESFSSVASPSKTLKLR
ncbi:MAG: DNA repair protein RadC [Opitutales bacterium]|nr:DNA repair protein RadC [Opitutales bacterium]